MQTGCLIPRLLVLLSALFSKSSFHPRPQPAEQVLFAFSRFSGEHEVNVERETRAPDGGIIRGPFIQREWLSKLTNQFFLFLKLMTCWYCFQTIKTSQERMLSSLKLRKWTQRRGRLKKAFQASEARFSKDPAFGPGKLFYVYQAKFAFKIEVSIILKIIQRDDQLAKQNWFVRQEQVQLQRDFRET